MDGLVSIFAPLMALTPVLSCLPMIDTRLCRKEAESRSGLVTLSIIMLEWNHYCSQLKPDHHRFTLSVVLSLPPSLGFDAMRPKRGRSVTVSESRFPPRDRKAAGSQVGNNCIIARRSKWFCTPISIIKDEGAILCNRKTIRGEGTPWPSQIPTWGKYQFQHCQYWSLYNVVLTVLKYYFSSQSLTLY